jgi:hypothetical protein
VQNDILAIMLKREVSNKVLKKESFMPSKDGSKTINIPIIKIGLEKHR